MSKRTVKNIRILYGILLSLSLAAAGICLMAGCLILYRSGDQPFSRESVAAVFSRFSLPVWLCLGLTAGGLVLDRLLPPAEKKTPPLRQDAAILRRLQQRADFSALPPQTQQTLRSLRRVRKGLRLGCGILVVLSCAVFAGYILTGDRFLLPDINTSMLRAMGVLLPCLALTLGFGIFTLYSNRRSRLREIELLRQAPSVQAPPAPVPQTPSASGRIRLAVLVLAIVLLAVGYFSGGTADVLTKAINICTECVGLG